MSVDAGNDEAVRSTNDDASLCKRYAVQLGYWRDPYIGYFVRAGERKTPEINRGYYARVSGIKLLVDQFIAKADGHCQIINLGAGFDTLYWRLGDEGITPSNFIEVDFPDVTSRKCFHIKRSLPLLQRVHREDGEVRFSTSDLHGSAYHLVSADLRSVAELEEKLNQSDVVYSIPTLFLAECVLVYMDPSQSKQLLHWIGSKFATVLFLNYEQVNMEDRFGEVMLNNLHARGCGLPGVANCKTQQTQKDRYLQIGWEGAAAWDMTSVYAALPQDDIQRIEKIEFLDERELLQQLFQHYCIAIGWKDDAKLRLDEVGFG